MAYKQIDLNGLRTYSAAQRASKVKADNEGKPPRAGMTVKAFLDGLPAILKAEDLKAVARAVVNARESAKPVIVMLGGHVIKTGCSPILADLAANGFIQHFASNGSAAVHDVELACWGQTSEDVADHLENGSFGMAADTAGLINAAADKAAGSGEGFGESLGALLVQQNPPHLQRALLATAYRLKLPYTLHVAMGTDIVHQHPSANGAAIGEASLRDFRILAQTVSQLGQGGVVLNLGSAVIMPEVFLKALTVTRNLGHAVFGFTTANFDMIQHYRPNVNVVQRPVITSGKGYAITGHHEIMIPLLAAAIYEMAQEMAQEMAREMAREMTRDEARTD
jgi:Arginine dihydrolase ArgZ-like, C-terminal, Rossmann fold